jgi:hypothetical protein
MSSKSKKNSQPRKKRASRRTAKPKTADVKLRDVNRASRADLLELRIAEQKGANRPEIIERIDDRLAGDIEKEPLVIEIKRHIAGPPRRAPGQTLRISREQIEQQRLEEGRDYRRVES